jgi:hypothetical protein
MGQKGEKEVDQEEAERGSYKHACYLEDVARKVQQSFYC